MILKSVVVRRFKRFQEVRFDVPGHTVVVGPNNAGKTTLLQAIAAWDFALRKWKEWNDFKKHGGAFTYVNVGRADFAAVPLRQFDLLWNERVIGHSIEVEVTLTGRAPITMEFRHDSTEQIKIRPTSVSNPDQLRQAEVRAVFIPPMSGLDRDEAEYARDETIDAYLAQGRPGEVLRNLLVRAHRSGDAWAGISDAIKRLFNAELIPPRVGAKILSEYKQGTGTQLDIASAGSGLQQVLMLLAFLHTRPGSILLVDEPDAHLHVYLQDAIYGELKRVAAAKQSQLILATHSEVIMDSVDAGELVMLLDKPRILGETVQRAALKEAMRVLSHADIMRGQMANGIVYVEGRTDLEILREWAKILGHPLQKFLEGEIFWKPINYPAEGGDGITSGAHYKAIRLVKEMPAFELVDGDDGRGREPTEVTGQGFQRARWRRYEIESYLYHPAALERFVEREIGAEAAGPAKQALAEYLKNTNPPQFLANPLDDIPFLVSSKARDVLIPPALQAAGLHGINYTRFSEIAALMKPEEIHPEVKEKLDALKKALNL